MANTPASNKVTGFSGEVMDTSNAAVLPKIQLGRKTSGCMGLTVVAIINMKMQNDQSSPL